MKRKNAMKVLTISLSASMLLNPIVALAEDSADDASESSEKNEENLKLENDGATDVSDHEAVKEQLTDTATELVTVDGQVEEADTVEGTDYSEAKDALDIAVDEIRVAANDVQASNSIIEREKSEASRIEVETENVDGYISSVDKALSESTEASVDAVNKDAAINVNRTTVAEAEKAISDINDDLKEANDKLSEAEGNLSKAQAAFDIADKEYATLLFDDSASEAALKEAKTNVTDAESWLIAAQKNVEENAAIVGQLEEKAQKLAVYNQINDLRNEIEAMSSEDEGYVEKVNQISELIAKYYLFNKYDEGTDITFGEGLEEYVTNYERDEEGNLNPVKTSIGYKTVTYIEDGKEVTRKIDYSFDDKGNITISEKNISATESEMTVLPQIVLTNEKGEEYKATDTSHVIYMDADDEQVGFYAIDTESSEKIAEIKKHDLLPDPGDSETSKDEEYNEVIKVYNSITSIAESPSTISYELEKDGIAEVEYKQFDVEYTETTRYVETGAGYTHPNSVYEAVEARIDELKMQYLFEITIERITYDTTVIGSMYTLTYRVDKKKKDVMELPVSKKIYKAEEYYDRSGTQKYVDENGAEYQDKADNIVVYKDASNKNNGFYASDRKKDRRVSQFRNLGGSIAYERDASGHDKKTVVYYSPVRDVKKTVEMDTVAIMHPGDIEVTNRTLTEDESLYDVLNEYRKQETVGVRLRGVETDEFDCTVNFSDSRWYDAADEYYAKISEKAGGCYLELSEQANTTEYFTGLTEKSVGRRTIKTEVYLTDYESGSCVSMGEAEDTIEAIKEILSQSCEMLFIEWISLREEETEDGESVWNYGIKYEYLDSRNVENVDVVEELVAYGYKEYDNADKQVLSIYDVSEKDEALVSTDDAAFKDVIAEKNKAYSDAVIARDKVNKATKAYEDALESVKKAKEAVVSLEAAGVSKAILNGAKEKYEEAQKKLEDALKSKDKAEEAYAKAKVSLTSAERKLDIIKARPDIIRPEETSGNIAAADYGTPQAGASSNEEYAAAPAAVSQTGTVTDQSQEEVLGAVREKNSPKISTTSEAATQDNNDEVKEEPSSNGNNTETKKTETEKPEIKEIEEVMPALAPTITTPEEASRHFMTRLIFAVAVIGGVAGAAIASIFVKGKIR